MMAPINKVLNRITMYRVVLYCLLTLGGAGLMFAFLGQGVFTFTGPQALLSLVILVSASYLSNKLFGFLYGVATNHESAVITGLILFLILPPGSSKVRILSLIIAATVAMASKYVLVWRGRHIFNPAGLAVTITGLVGLINPSWWVGAKLMLPFLIVCGFVIAKKVHRLQLVLGFIVVSLICLAAKSIAQDSNTVEILRLALVSSPLIFFGSVMLTEPATSPYKQRQLLLFALLVALISVFPWNVGPVQSSTELGLVIGNLAFVLFWFSPSYSLKFKQKINLGGNSYNFVFTPDRSMDFVAGQFGEWTLPGVKLDSRGNRRTFTIASSPKNPDVFLGVKIFEHPSKFKQRLMSLKPGQQLQLSHVAGEFVLPSDQSRPLVFIAGGIGITPFLAMIQELISTKQSRNIVLFYCANNPDELSYLSTLEQARAEWLTIIPIVSRPENAPQNWRGKIGPITSEMLRELPRYKERRYYLSGPPSMVDAYKKALRGEAIPARQITVDYFSGY